MADRDSRVDAVVQAGILTLAGSETAKDAIGLLEEAGLLVIDPKDADVEKRLHDLLMMWFETDDEAPCVHPEYLAENIAQDILTVLAERPALTPNLPGGSDG